jgi:hypothetical protein
MKSRCFDKGSNAGLAFVTFFVTSAESSTLSGSSRRAGTQIEFHQIGPDDIGALRQLEIIDFVCEVAHRAIFGVVDAKTLIGRAKVAGVRMARIFGFLRNRGSFFRGFRFRRGDRDSKTRPLHGTGRDRSILVP